MEKTVKFMFITGCMFLNSFHVSQSKCTISKDWIELTMEERLLMSQNVVYGKTKEHRANVRKIAGKSYYEIDAIFEVYCILKSGEEPVKEEIKIERIAPRDGCSGTKDHMKIGEEAILGLKLTNNGKYEYDEMMPAQSASFAASKLNFYTLSAVCDLQSWAAPVNATVNKCPVCGMGNFTRRVMDSAVNEKFRPCFVDGISVGNDTNCNMFVTDDVDTTSTCIPADFDNTCMRLFYVRPSVECECEMTPLRQMGLGGLSEIDAGYLTLPSAFTTVLACVFAVFLPA